MRIAAWNANGLKNHVHEVTLFLKLNKIDVLLISESHTTDYTAIKIQGYSVYYAHHPDGTAHAGSALLIRSALDHYALEPYTTNKIQSIAVQIKAFPWPLQVGAIYSPPRHTISTEEYKDFFLTLGSHFLIAGDWNAKHTTWGSRLITPKGRNLYTVLRQLNLQYLSTGEPTYWPTDLNKIPDLLDFAVVKGISDVHRAIESNLDLSSDHSAIIITLSTHLIWKTPPPKLFTNETDWKVFQQYISRNIDLTLRLQTTTELEDAVDYIINLIQEAAWRATPPGHQIPPDKHNVPLHIRHLITEKRRARSRWQRTRNLRDKTVLNRLTHELTNALKEVRNETFRYYVSTLSPNDHTIWKATKKINRPITPIPPIRKHDGSWARSHEEKADTFAHHLAQVFKPLPSKNPTFDSAVEEYLNAPGQLSLPPRPFTPAEVWREIRSTNPHKAPGYDLITGKILKALPRKAIVLLTIIYNSILRLGHFPLQWKYALVIMIAKPGKPPQQTNAYRPISLLPLLSKIFERLLITRINDALSKDELLPLHQFGFREGHSTIQQCHRIVNRIRESLEQKKVCASVFLDIEQAFDKVWHQGLLYKLRKQLPDQIFLILKSYITDRYFQVKIEHTLSHYHPVQSGVPQGSVLGPLLYLIFTADIPTTADTLIATFADDTAILSSDSRPDRASEKLQQHLNNLQTWLDQWRIKVNNAKSTQITFTTTHIDCPQTTIYNTPIPIRSEVKYLGLHLDRRLTWQAHIKAKRQQLNLRIKKYYWLIGKNSPLSIENKLLLYKVILKPVWTYGIELWGCSKPSNTKILQTFQSKTLRLITNAPWFVSNQTLHNDLRVDYINKVITAAARKSRDRNFHHRNRLIVNLYSRPLATRRLHRRWPEDLIE